MTILNIRPARRTGSKIVIGIAGQSGDGKTYTALQIARGMVKHPSEIGFIDAENRRGSLYADILDDEFLIGDLFPPFSPKRYADAIKEFQDAGVKVLIIDSVSHEWEGEGGCEDMANAPLLQGKKMADWKKAKYEHKKFMNALLQSDMHIIACIRAREKTDFRIPSKPVSLGVQPITEKNFMFEMTASMMMRDAGKRQEFIKPLPPALQSAFGNGQGYLGQDVGRAIIQWVNSGDQTDIDLEPYKARMQMACSDGMKALVTQFQSMPADIQARMKPLMAQYKASAEEYDKMTQEDEQEPVSGSDLPEPPQTQTTAQQTSRTDI